LKLEKIIINNFRNYVDNTFEPGPKINVIYGENAQGKTNLLEAIYYLLSSISHRSRKDGELVNWESKYFKVKGTVSFKEKKKKKLEIIYENSKNKSLKINDNVISTDKYFSQFPSIILYPQDLNLIKEGPALRRRFLNTEITRINPVYYEYLLNYYRALRQRNNILKKAVKKKEELSSWENILAQYGSKIIINRVYFLQELNKYAPSYQEIFSSGKEKIELYYKTQIKFKKEIGQRENRYLENDIQEKILELVDEKRMEEYNKGHTLVGPHLEDMGIMLNGRELKKYSSQGQQRTTVISIKFAQADILMEKKEETPILLMDDSFSELDNYRGKLILDLIAEKQLQCFITTYESLKLPSNCEGDFFRIEGGIIENG